VVAVLAALVPVTSCTACQGAGRFDDISCDACSGTGSVEETGPRALTEGRLSATCLPRHKQPITGRYLGDDDTHYITLDEGAVAKWSKQYYHKFG